MDQETNDGVIDDWVSFLSQFSKRVIEDAFSAHMREEPNARPTPGAILKRAKSISSGGTIGVKFGNRDELLMDERRLLEEKILPNARRWLSIPALADHGRQTLAYWGEKC